jgi:hypothetical protein
MAFVLIGAVMAVGVFFFWLHSLPERLVHKSTKLHFDIVAVLGLLSLFTHIHAFWVAALLLALVRLPDFSMPDVAGLLARIAGSLESMADQQHKKGSADDTKQPQQEHEHAASAGPRGHLCPFGQHICS